LLNGAIRISHTLFMTWNFVCNLRTTDNKMGNANHKMSLSTTFFLKSSDFLTIKFTFCN
jgi:hypothetical protein